MCLRLKQTLSGGRDTHKPMFELVVLCKIACLMRVTVVTICINLRLSPAFRVAWLPKPKIGRRWVGIKITVVMSQLTSLPNDSTSLGNIGCITVICVISLRSR